MLFHHFSPMGSANQRATTLPIPRVVSRDLHISPRFTPTILYRDACTALLHLVNQRLNFSSLRPHAFRYENQKKISLLLRHKFRLSERMLYPLFSCTRDQVSRARRHAESLEQRLEEAVRRNQRLEREVVEAVEMKVSWLPVACGTPRLFSPKIFNFLV